MPLWMARSERYTRSTLRVAGLFAGIGGIELGLERAGHVTRLLCENDPAARAVLRLRFPRAIHRQDIRRLKTLSGVDLVTAGFPCQDLSQAGRTVGIGGSKSGLVSHLFRLLHTNVHPNWILLENVPFMLQLDRGQAMSWLAEQFENLGYSWAYRTVDTRSFGLPHRRRRVLFLASRRLDPKDVLFADEAPKSNVAGPVPSAFGFYWTEGNTGLGWARDAVPTLKGGSGLGIPSPPAIWIPQTDEIGLPHISDGERLQGFPEDWTKASLGSMVLGPGVRWRLVGNAVSVPVSEWLGRRLSEPGQYTRSGLRRLAPGEKWPSSAFGDKTGRWEAAVSEFPIECEFTPLRQFLSEDLQPLSFRAAKGFLCRFQNSSLRKDEKFVAALRKLVRKQERSESLRSSSADKMRSVKQSGTDLETRLIRALRAKRLSFEKNTYAVKSIRTKPDVIFRAKRVAVYVDGCFWHRCPQHGTRPRANSAYWDEKLRDNANRDEANTKALRMQGWKVLRFWGHQDPEDMVHKIRRMLRAG